jgi:putative NADH-flavin reductase
MKLLILGATGPTGRQVVSQALGLGHHVTALVRDATRLTITSERLRVITGSVTDDRDALNVATRGQDAVISTLGVGNSLNPHGLIARSIPAIFEAMKTTGVARLIFTSAYGVGDTRRDVPFVPNIFMRVLLRDIYADKAAGEEILRRSSLDWTLVYPVTLTNGPKSGHYRTGERLALSGFPRISRADVADFLLKQLEDKTYVRKGVLISGW